MNKEEAMDEFLATHVFDKWMEDLLPIHQTLEQQRAGIEQSFGEAFDQVWLQAERLQKQGAKGDIHYVYISLLRTRIMENEPSYRIDVYDANWFMDQMPCTVLWRADFIFDPFFRRMEELEKEKTAYARKITSMDVERIGQIEAFKYHSLAIEFMKTQIPQLLASSAYERVGKSPNIRWMAGEFRDQSELLVDGGVLVDDGKDSVSEA